MTQAIRSLMKSPGYTSVAIGMLALGIGASTAIFSVVHALMIAPLPYHDSSRLVQVYLKLPKENPAPLSPATFADVEQQSRAIETMAAQQYDYVNLTRTTSPARLTGDQVTTNYFRVF